MATLNISGDLELDVLGAGGVTADKWSFQDRFTLDHVDSEGDATLLVEINDGGLLLDPSENFVKFIKVADSLVDVQNQLDTLYFIPGNKELGGAGAAVHATLSAPGAETVTHTVTAPLGSLELLSTASSDPLGDRAEIDGQVSQPFDPQSEASAGEDMSPEVANLYHWILLRDGDPEGLAFWTQYSQENPSHSLPWLFLESLEAQGTGTPIILLYQLAFGRVPDQGGLAYWQNRIKESNDVDFLLNELVASDEFHVLHNDVSRETFIRSLYENGLGRAPDEEGLQFWLHSSFSCGFRRSRPCVPINVRPPVPF